MRRIWIIAVMISVFIFCAYAFSQTPEEIEKAKERILKRVKEYIKKEAEKLQEELSALIKEEIAKLTKKETKTEEKFEPIESLQEAFELFEEALEYHQDEEYDESIKMFKRIFYSFPDQNVGFTAAYNVACGYSLKGDKKNAIKWLEISIKNGFRNFRHMERDTDLDNIRNEPEYKELIKKYKGED